MRRRKKRRENVRRTRERKPLELTPAETKKKSVPRRTSRKAPRENARTTVALIPDAPAGTILTHAAGMVRISATLAGKDPFDKDIHIIPQAIFDDIGEGAWGSFVARKGEGGLLVVEGEVMALDHGCMGRAVEVVTRRISEVAALAEAVLEMKCVREAEPAAASEEAVIRLARELSGAGFPVCADVLRRPSPGGEVWLGAGGGHADALRDFIEARPELRVV